ncbi:GAP family protein [Streptomyces sp. NBC_01142]|uniref:GAP family protein n=1 Tax=Streptomyces sp. NBC_01142 TaxID=2975865 RepID=UPI00224F06B9|nr:GAP family protein [Streptomyces sp. NBC_01142]MCX4820147.1 GAP family protein [Streptomyces sp. NBC_01142]
MALDLFLIGLAITLYPLPIMAFVLVLTAPRGVWKGLAFVLAWLACLVAVIAVVLAVTGGEPPAPKSPPSTAVLAAKLAIGVALVLYSEHRRRRRRTPAKSSAASRAPSSRAPSTLASSSRPSSSRPSLTSRMDQASAWSAAALALLLQPWGMVCAGAATVVDADLSHAESYLALMGFCILATASLLAMELYMVFAPEKAQRALTNLRSWLSAHQERAIVVLCLLLGLWLTGKSLYQLTS